MNIFKNPFFYSSTFNFLIVLSLLLAGLYSFSGVFFGLDFTDSFYHLNQALNPADGIFLYPFFLSSVIIKWLIELAGTNIFNLRVINWLLLVTSMFLPFIFLKVKSKWSVIILYFTFTLILYAPFNANILGYDTLSILINSLLFALTALYLKDRKNYLIILLAIFAAMAIMIRLPNILTVPVIFIFILVSERINNGKWEVSNFLKPLGFLISTFLITIAGFALYYDSWKQFHAASSNADSHHLLSLFLKYLQDVIKIFGYIVLLLAGRFVYQRSNMKTVNFLNEGLLIVFFLLSLYFLVGVSKFSANYSHFLVAIAISLVAVQIAFYKGKRNTFRYLILYLFLFFLFIYPLGSNTGLLKAYSLLLLLPFVISLHELENRNYWLILLLVLIPFSIITKLFGVYEDKNMLALNTKLEIEELSPVYTNFIRQDYLQKTDVLVQQLNSQGVEVFFYGDKSHIFHFLYPATSLNISSFFQPVDDPDFFREFSEDLKYKDKIAVFIVNSYPENSPAPVSLLEMEIMNAGFKKVEDESLRYYLRTPNNENK